jgi:DNA-directed RNA polymerase alpha subunit
MSPEHIKQVCELVSKILNTTSKPEEDYSPVSAGVTAWADSFVGEEISKLDGSKLSVRAVHILATFGIRTVRDLPRLDQLSSTEILEARNSSEATLVQISEFAVEKGYSLKDSQ